MFLLSTSTPLARAPLVATLYEQGGAMYQWRSGNLPRGPQPGGTSAQSSAVFYVIKALAAESSNRYEQWWNCRQLDHHAPCRFEHLTFCDANCCRTPLFLKVFFFPCDGEATKANWSESWILMVFAHTRWRLSCTVGIRTT
eukprot:5870622-Amphidinium_carterae.1